MVLVFPVVPAGVVMPVAVAVADAVELTTFALGVRLVGGVDMSGHVPFPVPESPLPVLCRARLPMLLVLLLLLLFVPGVENPFVELAVAALAWARLPLVLGVSGVCCFGCCVWVFCGCCFGF